MRLHTLAPIHSLEGRQLSHPDKSPATFRSCVVAALVMRSPRTVGNGPLTYQLFKLAQRISDHAVAELSVEELATIKEQVAAYPEFNAVVVGRIFDMIEGEPAPALAAVKE